jgi:hypothetical protein
MRRCGAAAQKVMPTAVEKFDRWASRNQSWK